MKTILNETIVKHRLIKGGINFLRSFFFENQINSRASQGKPKGPQRTAKGKQRHPKGDKGSQRHPKGSSKDGQREPMTSQRDPKGRPEEAKGTPKRDKGSQRHPKGRQREPKGGQRKTGRESGEGSYINKLPINRKAAIYLYVLALLTSSQRP